MAEVYAIFDYPPDMQGAIYYMPVASTERVRVGDQLFSPLEALDALIRSPSRSNTCASSRSGMSSVGDRWKSKIVSGARWLSGSPPEAAENDMT